MVVLQLFGVAHASVGSGVCTSTSVQDLMASADTVVLARRIGRGPEFGKVEMTSEGRVAAGPDKAYWNYAIDEVVSGATGLEIVEGKRQARVYSGVVLMQYTPDEPFLLFLKWDDEFRVNRLIGPCGLWQPDLDGRTRSLFHEISVAPGGAITAVSHGSLAEQLSVVSGDSTGAEEPKRRLMAHRYPGLTNPPSEVPSGFQAFLEMAHQGETPAVARTFQADSTRTASERGFADSVEVVRALSAEASSR